jgi:hypothetical protein
VGAEHSLACRNTNYCRVDHILGGEVQSLGVNSKYTITKYGYYQLTSYNTINEASYY